MRRFIAAYHYFWECAENRNFQDGGFHIWADDRSYFIQTRWELWKIAWRTAK